MVQFEGARGDPIAARRESVEREDRAVRLGPGEDRTVPLRELRSKGVGDDPGDLRVT